MMKTIELVFYSGVVLAFCGARFAMPDGSPLGVTMREAWERGR